MNGEKKANLAFVFSLTSRLLMLVSTISFLFTPAFMASTYEETYPWFMMSGNMMVVDNMRAYFWFGKWTLFSLIIGVVRGVAVLMSSLMLRSKPKENLLWGTLIITFSALSVFSTSSLFLGFILGILGGTLAIIEV